MATLTDLLTEAQAAQHDLLTGNKVARARDSNGEEVQYTQADATKLAEYIQSLQNQIAAAAGQPSQTIGPIRLWF